MEYNGKTVDSFKKHLKNPHAKIIDSFKKLLKTHFFKQAFY